MDALPNEIVSMILDDVIAPTIRHQRHAWDMVLVCKCVCKLWYAVTWRATGYPSTLYESSEYSRAAFCAALRGSVELVKWLSASGRAHWYVYQGAIISGNSEIIAWCSEWYYLPTIGFDESVIYMALRHCDNNAIDRVMRRFDSATVENVCCDYWKVIHPHTVLYVHARHDVHFGEYVYKLLHNTCFDVLEWLLANGIADCAICELRTHQKIVECSERPRHFRAKSDAIDRYAELMKKYKTPHDQMAETCSEVPSAMRK